MKKQIYDFCIGNVLDRTIIGIEQCNGRKIIHYYAFGWLADGSANTPYRFAEYTGFIVDLEKGLEYGISNFESEYQEEIKQYVEDCTEEQCADFYAHYDNGNPPKFISEKDVSMTTAYGVYILTDTKTTIIYETEEEEFSKLGGDENENNG